MELVFVSIGEPLEMTRCWPSSVPVLPYANFCFSKAVI